MLSAALTDKDQKMSPMSAACWVGACSRWLTHTLNAGSYMTVTQPDKFSMIVLSVDVPLARDMMGGFRQNSYLKSSKSDSDGWYCRSRVFLMWRLINYLLRYLTAF